MARNECIGEVLKRMLEQIRTMNWLRVRRFATLAGRLQESIMIRETRLQWTKKKKKFITLY